MKMEIQQQDINLVSMRCKYVNANNNTNSNSQCDSDRANKY